MKAVFENFFFGMGRTMSAELAQLPGKCVVCDSAAGCVQLVTLPQGTVLRCKSCGAHSISPQPTVDALVAAYQNFDAGEIVRQEFEAYVEQAKSILRADFDAAGLQIHSRLRFLDYGCGGGHFVKAAAQLGADAYGIDLDGESQRFGQKHSLRVEVGDCREIEAKFGNQPFTAILLMHVLEHVPRPIDVLRALVGRLEPGGILIVRVPDQHSVPSHLKRILRRVGIKTNEWGYVQPPIHLHGYGRGTFEALAKTHALEVVRLDKTSPLDATEFPTTERYWRGLGVHKQVYRLSRALGSGGHLVAILRRGPRRMAATGGFQLGPTRKGDPALFRELIKRSRNLGGIVG